MGRANDVHGARAAGPKARRARGQAEPAAPVGALCPHAGTCGGCTQVNVPYARQLAAKDDAVARLFAGDAFSGCEVRPILGMANPFHYRDKVTSPFAPGKRTAGGRREILCGMYAAGTHRIVDTSGCLIENERAQLVVSAVRSLMGRHGIEPYDENRGTGFMRHVVVRVGHESGEVLVTLVTNARDFPRSKSFCRELVRRCPFVTTVVQNVNTRLTNVILGNEERRLFGPGFILDTLCGLSFRISSQSFYQVNAKQTEVLYEQAMKLAGLREGEAAIDAYCGTGTIGLVAASRGASEVIGVDSVESAIRDARQNARHNGIQNARFVTADAGAFMRELAQTGRRIDAVLMDPPRAGASEEFLRSLGALAPQRVVYVSCNPATQVRDGLMLAQAGYRVRVVQPVDMFPHTDHIETVVLLSKDT